MSVSFPGLFEGVNDVDAATATRRFTRRTLAAGELLLKEGSTGDEVVGVLSGALEARRGDVVLAEIGPGQLVGELALFEAVRRTAAVSAKWASEVLVISRDAYEELRDTAHPVAANLERVVMVQQAARLREMDVRIALLSEGTRRPIRFPGQDFFARVTAEFGRGGLFDAIGVDREAALLSSGLVADVSEVVLVELAKRMEVTVCGSGQVLCTEGTSAERLWLIEAGDVEVLVTTGDDEVQTLAKVGPGSLVGAGALVDGGTRMATCVASSRVVALTLDLKAWAALMDDAAFVGSALRRAVIRALAYQLAGANAMVAHFELAHESTSLKAARSRLVASLPPQRVQDFDPGF